MNEKLTGLIAATFTPMHRDGSLNLDLIPAMVDYLLQSGVSGLYVGGSTGEGMSLTTGEREAVAETYVEAAAGRLPVIVQVGHNSLEESRHLARHAAKLGVTALSATPPCYFRPRSQEVLIECMAEIASAAPEVPFYYYFIPKFCGNGVSMVDFLPAASRRIPNLKGVKFSDLFVADYQSCLDLDKGRFDVLWGCDEMLLSALVVGAKAAVGSTYNFMAPIYCRVMAAFEDGDLAEARTQMSVVLKLMRVMNGRYAPLAPAMKFAMSLVGFDCGPCRIPLAAVSDEAAQGLTRDLVALGLGKE